MRSQSADFGCASTVRVPPGHRRRWRRPSEAARPDRLRGVSVGFDRIEDLDDALPPDVFRRDPLPYVAAFLAGKAFGAYRQRGGTTTTPLPDFFIGAHAAAGEFALLTRDV